MRIIRDYKRGHLSLEEAAPQLRAAFRAVPGGINLQVSPRTRRLLAEVARLDGDTIPVVGPHADRHSARSEAILADLAESLWRAVSNHPRAHEPLTIVFHFAASSETTARAIVDWLQGHGQLNLELQSPDEADADDWMIHAATPATRWSQPLIEQWAAMVRAAPLGGEASFTGWGV